MVDPSFEKEIFRNKVVWEAYMAHEFTIEF